MTNPYTLDLAHIYWKPETANRTDSHGLDTTNDASDTFYRFPIVVKSPPIVRVNQSRVAEHIGGYADYAVMYKGDYPPVELEFTGVLIDFNMFVQMLYGGTTTPDSPSAGLYTRTYASTTVRTNPAPTFRIMNRFLNTTTAQSLILLGIGCVIKKFKIDAAAGNTVQLSFTISISKSIAGTALTSNPYDVDDRSFTLGQTSFTYNKGGSALSGLIYGFSILVDNDPKARQAVGAKWAYDWIPGYRKIELNIMFSMETKALITDADTEEVTHADDLDVIIKLERTATDYLQFSFEKLWDLLNENPKFEWMEFLLGQKQTLLVKPAWIESGGHMTVTEVNSSGTPAA